jgi:hypothetical protein
VPSVSVYYQTLSLIVPLFGRSEKYRQNPKASFRQLQDVVVSTTSPVQIAPISQVLQSAPISRAQLSLLMSSLASAIDRLPADNRSLFATDTGAISAVASLARFAPGTNDADVFPLVHALRNYLARSLKAPRCADTVQQRKNGLPRLYESFNRTFVTPQANIMPLPMPESDMAIEPRGDEHMYWQSSASTALLTEAKHLSFDNHWVKYEPSAYDSLDWQNRAQAFMDHLYAWKESDEADSSDYYHERCTLLLGALALFPRQSAVHAWFLAALIDTYERSSLQFDHPVEWFVEVARLLRSSQSTSSNTLPPDILTALSSSKNSYLNAIFSLEQFLR